MEDEVVAVFHLRKEQAVLTAGVFALPVGDEGRESGQPPLAALQKVSAGERVGEFLQTRGIGAFQKGAAALLKIDALLAHTDRQPVVLIEADPRGKREVGAHADKHPAPARVVPVEVELIHPALFELQMRAVVILIPDGYQDTRRFPRLHDGSIW